MKHYPERIFPSCKGIHLDFKNKADAEAYYQEKSRLKNKVEIHGNLVIVLH